MRTLGPTETVGTILLALALGLLADAAPISAADTHDAPAPVSTASGLLQGVEQAGVTIYLGVPFAAPPVGDLRWRAPRKVPPWNGVRTAAHVGNLCMQQRLQGPEARMPGGPAVSDVLSEDCLYLNLWVAQRPAAAKLPVLVYIHGGSFEHGSGGQPEFDGANLARRGAVLVTLNYRLGRFGFFAHPALTRESPAAPIGNYGILDQIAALNWVRQNVAAFGGDPGNITLVGESAGGISVSYLMESPLARGLFQRAIIESGIISGPPRDAATTLPQAETAGMAAAKSWGLAQANPAALRRVSAEQVLGNATAPSAWPMIDGKIIPEDLTAAFAAGHIAHVPLLLGTNTHEVGFGPLSQLPRGMSQRLGARWSEVTATIDGYGTHRTDYIEDELVTDMMFTAPTRLVAQVAAQHGLPTYLYSFSYIRPSQRGQVPGPSHFDETYAVFGTMGLVEPRVGADTDRIIDEVQSRWVRFAKTGQPTQVAAQWPRFTPDAESLLEFSNTGPIVRTHFASERVTLADKFTSATQGR
ncbi:MAG TPA: carboxylesterase family protein [Steroidobacteraceae bacterium]|nr:carboxylesterase family protein [Steroidobacteraceae bacterium]